LLQKINEVNSKIDLAKKTLQYLEYGRMYFLKFIAFVIVSVIA